MGFDIRRYMDSSKAVDTSDLDWDYIAKVGIAPYEARCLRYLSDIESHAILYQRDLLAGHTKTDYQLVAFLSCWVYEEMHHGWALDKFLAACGYPVDEHHYSSVTKAASVKEDIEAWLSHSFARATPHFAATHMAWGALNEMTSSLAYTQIARCTQNKELAKLTMRMAKDERRHQAFYYDQAERRLGESQIAQKIARFAFQRFWDPVGLGVGEDDSFGFFVIMYFDNERGMAEFKRIDENMGKLPGLEGFDVVYRKIWSAGETFKSKYPEQAREIAAYWRKRSEERDATSAATSEAMEASS